MTKPRSQKTSTSSFSNANTAAHAMPEWLQQLANPLAWENVLQQAPINFESFNASLTEMGSGIDPEALGAMQSNYLHEMNLLWQEMLSAKLPAISDKRFSAPAWQSSPMAAFNASAYLLNSKYLAAMADAIDAPPKAKQKVRFTVQQMIDAMSPANFLATNPEAQQKMIDTNGESLVRGVTHMLEDLKKGHISQTDENAFEVGKNVATSEGAVVYENDLFQLIQYKALTKTVAQRPLLIVPPCINKFYILDLQPDNSLVRYAVDQGNTVFLVSWRNVDASNGHKTEENYIEDAVITALHVTQEISGQEQVNALGFCIGGTMLATALAILAARGEQPVASLTLLTSFLDFSDTGVIDVYVDEMAVAMREKAIGGGGLIPGKDFASAFSSLRSNDLIWNYVGANYLKGEDPSAFDLLYWNADSTNLPGPMFCWYLRNTYLENNLSKPGKLTVCGEKVDFGKINVPAFIYASREDHIVPWTSAYTTTSLINTKKPALNRFVLGASGHIAGVVNPPAKKKRNYWSNKKNAADAASWFEGATEHAGSWWPEWAAFLATHGGKRVAAPRTYGNKSYKAIEPAPGRYVKQKAD
jgi:polyhydroxyalkanoate synthase